MRFYEIIYGPLEIITIIIVVEFEGQYYWNFVVKGSRQLAGTGERNTFDRADFRFRPKIEEF